MKFQSASDCTGVVEPVQYTSEDNAVSMEPSGFAAVQPMKVILICKLNIFL